MRVLAKVVIGFVAVTSPVWLLLVNLSLEIEAVVK